MKSSHSSVFAHVRTVYANRSEPEYARAFADLYWRTLLILACIVIIGACAYGAMLFSSALSQLSVTASVSTPGPTTSSTINRTQLDATLAGFSSRQADFQSLQSGSIPAVADPSQ